MEMSKKEFTEHLNEFMEYMRKMENGMSHNWDVLTKFQEDLTKSSKHLVDEIRSDERITDLKTVIKSIQEQISRNESTNCGIINEMNSLKDKIRTEFCHSLHSLQTSHHKMLDELRALEKRLDRFSHINAEELATRGAKKALEFVKEYKEARVFMNSVRDLLGKEQLNKMESLTGISYHSDLDLTIDECEFTVRTQNVLRYAGLITMDHVFKFPKSKFGRLRNAGKKCLMEINKWFLQRDLEWK